MGATLQSCCVRFSLWWLFLLQSTGSRASGLQLLWPTGWVDLPQVELSGSRDQTYVPCTNRWIPNYWTTKEVLNLFLLLLFSHSVVSDSLWPHGVQHTRLPCPSPSLEPAQTHVHWVGDAIQPSHPLSSPSPPVFRSFPASGSFLMSRLFASGGQSIRASASISFLLMNIQDWFPLGLTGWTSLQSKGLSRVFSNTTVQKHSSYYYLICISLIPGDFQCLLSSPVTWGCTSVNHLLLSLGHFSLGLLTPSYPSDLIQRETDSSPTPHHHHLTNVHPILSHVKNLYFSALHSWRYFDLGVFRLLDTW